MKRFASLQSGMITPQTETFPPPPRAVPLPSPFFSGPLPPPTTRSPHWGAGRGRSFIGPRNQLERATFRAAALTDIVKCLDYNSGDMEDPQDAPASDDHTLVECSRRPRASCQPGMSAGAGHNARLVKAAANLGGVFLRSNMLTTPRSGELCKAVAGKSSRNLVSHPAVAL